MLKSEFISKVSGIPWKNRACTFEAADCWGLVVLFYRYVLGKEIHHSAGYESGEDFITCFKDEVVFWRLTPTFSDGCIFIAYYGSQQAHVGLIVNGMALHSRGESGHVRADPVRMIQKLYTKVEFYTYADDRDSARAGIAEGAS
ncbi:NlpC/P60 family protein [Pantoea sp. LMR881]|uniref:NlpC/P60 family protein n=1 Tax=Pantoea sp. LMR881 TaxID=3014336 RepID=UPI0022AF4B4F|nr:NlpC/P60 family protein [Pantoea sp. LMR881]MCZ4058023.1 NlpC/P60 family protein [Pantoea sp. LMR881]